MKRVTLTFDNGPHLVGTPEVLDVLSQRGVKATFFLVGERLRDPALQSLASRIRAEGHRIANHTLTHTTALGRTMGTAAAESEIGEAQKLIAPLEGEKLFRPNGEKGQLGSHMLSEDAVEYLERHAFTAVSWNCVPIDWVGPDGSWVQRSRDIMASLDWAVVVLHDHCQAGLIRHLEDFLDDLIADGVEFRFDYPKDVLLLDRGVRTEALNGHFTPREQFESLNRM